MDNATWSGGGRRLVKLLACEARCSGFDTPPRHLNFRDKSRYGWNVAEATLILNTNNEPTNNAQQTLPCLGYFDFDVILYF